MLHRSLRAALVAAATLMATAGVMTGPAHADDPDLDSHGSKVTGGPAGAPRRSRSRSRP